MRKDFRNKKEGIRTQLFTPTTAKCVTSLIYALNSLFEGCGHLWVTVGITV